jgi:hypothetical protein
VGPTCKWNKLHCTCCTAADKCTIGPKDALAAAVQLSAAAKNAKNGESDEDGNENEANSSSADGAWKSRVSTFDAERVARRVPGGQPEALALEYERAPDPALALREKRRCRTVAVPRQLRPLQMYSRMKFSSQSKAR